MRAPSDPLGGGDPVSDGALLVHGEEDQPVLPPHLHLLLVPCLAHGPWRAGASFRTLSLLLRRSSVVNVVVILICWLFCNRSRCCRFDVLIVLHEEQMMLF